MKNIKYIILFILTLSIISCEITDVNVDPDNPAEELVNAGAVYPGMITQTHRNLVALNGRIAGIVIQHFDGLDAQQAQYAQYNIGESDIDDAWDFGLYGGGAMTDCDFIIKKFPGEVSALAKLYMAANLGMATSTWGDVPYSDAFGGSENLTPLYDSQEEVYNAIQNLLTESINEGVSSGIGSFFGTGGGSANWIGIAHALKARYYLHLTSVEGSAIAAAKALAEVQQAFTSASAQPDFVYSLPAQNSNPLYLFENDRPATLGFGTTLNNMMINDPRLPLYTTNGQKFAKTPGLFWGQADSPTPLISYWEVKFIEAEAIVRTGGSDTGALVALQEAVRANMTYVGVSNVLSEIDNYANALTLSGSEQQKIETIITEKYKALYGNAPIESWVDYRRTGYPQLTPSPDAVPSVNPSLVIPRRFLYPITERLNNEANNAAAISAQGGHLLDDDLWAFPSN
ncbi:SusD/RagB family nutrient-binding outer membrane lipoprotein [Winogradskyella luteola]|uniref:SusD/RagB family nutrient-binding outer membrane lipoprotein n=1 Tax=Winogradskyella luteola TaxID=2828330 RepID=A0A9X1JNW5_9FLAO|nr:SusD/RagB family nutrient-binding outer membrane lipoprotein [Winogradskyella luteola]MBV7270070.1 SusD/RagB family nutrient-binding outer membrane lipoprotein [Winogradskyella luteola]